MTGVAPSVRDRVPPWLPAWLGIVAAIVAVEALGVLVLRAPGERLRFLVDLYTVEGLVAGLTGSFLAADRPFLAARSIARRFGDASERGPDEAPRRRRDRARGAALLGIGIGLFALAALLWALRPGRDQPLTSRASAHTIPGPERGHSTACLALSASPRTSGWDTPRRYG